MQIEAVVIYGKNGKRRVISFNLGKNNIISGMEKTGKSVVGQIIDYCLGSDKCYIASGVVRQYSDWFGILLYLGNEKCFVARKNPGLDKKFCNAMYYKVSKEVSVPEKVDWESNIDNEDFVKLITARLGIEENINYTPINNSRPDLIANIRHSLFYCFQFQYEIANPINLFHKESDDFIKQAIKDTMPYFFGATNREYAYVKQDLQELKRKYLLLERKEREQKSIMQSGKTKALQLLDEASQVALIDSSKYSPDNDISILITLLKEIEVSSISSSISSTEGDDLTKCQIELETLQNDLSVLNSKIDDVRRVIKISDDYNDACAEQKKRLESLDLFQKLHFEENTCPFCSQKVKGLFPAYHSLKQSLEKLNSDLDGLNANPLSLKEYLTQLMQEKNQLKEKITTKKNEIIAIQDSMVNAERYKDLSVRQGKIIGRISFWLESYKEEPVDYNEKNSLEQQIKEKERLLSEETIHERMDSIFNIVSDYMTQWAKEMDLEYKDDKYRFNPYSATVFVDTLKKGPIPLRNLGSGSNWVGVHLLIYFAFQKYFIEKNRPVPSFIFLDQPSQIYFPNQKDQADLEAEAVKKIYKFIHKRVEELNGKLQVIIVDHAYFPDDSDFNNATLERWDKDNNALIPYEWINGK